jgi:RNA binding exosome subunit
VEIRVFSHATEDIQRIQLAVCNILPESLANEVAFKQTRLTGHHGNPIILLETKLVDRKQLMFVLENIAERLHALDKENLNNNLKQRIERHNLYLRFDKQGAYMGAIQLSLNDPIHIKIHFKNKTPEEIIDICRKAGLII